MTKLAIDQQTFLSENWQKKHAFYRSSLEDFQCPISNEALHQLASEEYIEARVLHCHANGDWALNTGPIEASDIRPINNEPWSLLVQAVDQWHPEVQKLLQLFNFLPSWRLDDIMISLSSNGAGVGPHYDQYDVFLIQAQGTRTWNIGETFDDSAPMINTAGLKQLAKMDVIESYSVKPGDVLYLPPGTGHDGIATSDNCMTISVGFRAPSHAEILTDFSSWLAENTRDSDRFNDADRPVSKSPKQITDWDIDNIQSILQSYIDDKDQLKKWFGSIMTEQKYPELMPDDMAYTLKDWKIALAEADKVNLDPASRIAFDDSNLFIDARVYSREYISDQQLGLITGTATFSTKEFKSLFSCSKQLDQMLLESLNKGTFYIE